MGLFDKFKKTKAAAAADDVIVSVGNGEMMDITAVSDPVFSQKMMGDGAALKLSENTAVLSAPANGTLSVLFPTGHAFGITMKDGTELLVHCGINTVEADGDGFKLGKFKQGSEVKAGDPIVTVDVKKLSAKYDMTTMIIITNDNGKEIQLKNSGTVTIGDRINL